MNQIDKVFFEQHKDRQANKIDDILMDGETLLVSLKPNKTSLIWEAIFKVFHSSFYGQQLISQSLL